MPGWVGLLRPGGALGVSWNTRVAGRDELAALLTAAGLEVLQSAPYLALRHRVDQAIVRTGRALGPGPLALDARHAQHVADLTMYVRQSHAERDLAALGRAAAR